MFVLVCIIQQYTRKVCIFISLIKYQGPHLTSDFSHSVLFSDSKPGSKESFSKTSQLHGVPTKLV